MSEQEMTKLEREFREYFETLSVAVLRVLARRLGASASGTSKSAFIDALCNILMGRTLPVPKTNRGAPVKQNYLDPEVIQHIADIRRSNETKYPVGMLEVASPMPSAPPAPKRSEKMSGLLEILPAGYGFLRAANCRPDEACDVFVSEQTIRVMQLREGDLVCCTSALRVREETPEVSQILSVNGKPIGKYEQRSDFHRLVSCYPNHKFDLDIVQTDLCARFIDAFVPVGRGQRMLIAAPSMAGKSTLLKRLAQAIVSRHSECDPAILLIDARPEEVTDFRGSFYPEMKICYTTFDDGAEQHIRAARLTLSYAMRLAEMGHDAIVFVDSLNKLMKAYTSCREDALQAVRRYFGAARSFIEGGSLTVIATALIRSGDPADDTMYEELRKMSNSEVLLNRELAERRVYPAVDLKFSATRREDLLLDADVLKQFFNAREHAMRCGTEAALSALSQTEDNREFFSRAGELFDQ